MIDTRELQRGNLVLSGQAVMFVRGLDEEFVFLGEKGFHNMNDKQRFEHVNPIPLTEEWLIKFHFKKHSHYIGIAYNYNDFIIWLDEGKWRKADAEEYHSEGRELDYVHQLQNLYFALTGEELKPLL